MTAATPNPTSLPSRPSRIARFSPKVWPPDYSQDRKFGDY